MDTKTTASSQLAFPSREKQMEPVTQPVTRSCLQCGHCLDDGAWTSNETGWEGGEELRKNPVHYW